MSSTEPRIGIFVASMTGTADFCAEAIEDAFAAAGHASDRRFMDGLDAAALAPFDLVVIVSSTYGQGDIPDNGQALFAALEAGADLAGKRYAVFGLGDSTYRDTFAAAGRRWDAVMQAAGAVAVTPLEIHDAASGTLPEDKAGEWAKGWMDQI
jgi:MioC protein